MFTVVLLLAAGPAMAEGGNWNLDVIWGYQFFENDSDQDLEFAGFRLGRNLNDRWAIEGAGRWYDEDDGVDVRLFDLVAKYFLTDERAVRPYVLAGPGRFEIDVGFGSDSAWTFGVGAGLEVGLPGRFYLRPEVRQFWIDFDQLDDEVNGEASLSFGFRL